MGTKFYGTTLYGGSVGDGTVFSVTATGDEAVIHSFRATDGAGPFGDLLAYKGVLYGTTYIGGYQGDGVIFSVTPKRRFKVLHNFLGHSHDGQVPRGGLIAVNGTLYGTTVQGGPGNYGMVYSITTNGNFRIVHSFKGSDGSLPTSRLILVNGALYGTTTSGGKYNEGTVFRVDLKGNVKTLHSFGSTGDGVDPWAGLTNLDGTLYGTTLQGGATGNGAVFRVDLSGNEKVLYSFDGTVANGCRPYAGLTTAAGMLYGVTYGGATSSSCLSKGTIFRVAPDGGETTLHTFPGGNGGSNPYGGLLSIDGKLYGTGGYLGYHGVGTVFSLKP
jgi:uncharacterized repeat protein (TIGR03803 family)